MTIDTANKYDIKNIYELYEMATAFQKTVFEKQWEGFEQSLIEKEIDENRLWKIYKDNEIVCVFTINFTDKLFWGEKDNQPSIYIHRIALNDNFRGQNVMSKIIDWAKKYCFENEKQFIRMDTWGGNTKLIDYYKKCGFEHIKTIDLDDTKGLPLHYKGKLALLEMSVNENHNKIMKLTIDKYSEKNKGDFEKIWVDWLSNSMGIQPQQVDIDEVRNPVDNYIKRGGMAFYANQNNECIGVVAVKKLNENDYEFCKLVVSEKARGLGLGKKLVEECIAFVNEQNGQNLYLQSFHKLEVAVKMYKSMGFVDAPAPGGMLVVSRTEIIMKMKLNNN